MEETGERGRMILGLFRKDPRKVLIATLYERVATASRAPDLYLRLGVPDTLEGRFEALSLHVILVLRGLRGRASPADEIALELSEALFRDLDGVMREMGVGDTSVPKRMKKLAEAFYGRAKAYDGPIDQGDIPALGAVLARNAIGADGPAAGLARYVLAADRALREQPLDAILEAGPAFPAPGGFA